MGVAAGASLTKYLPGDLSPTEDMFIVVFRARERVFNESNETADTPKFRVFVHDIWSCSQRESQQLRIVQDNTGRLLFVTCTSCCRHVTSGLSKLYSMCTAHFSKQSRKKRETTRAIKKKARNNTCWQGPRHDGQRQNNSGVRRIVMAPRLMLAPVCSLRAKLADDQ